MMISRFAHFAALATLALLAASPAVQAGGRPIPMIEQVDVPLVGPNGMNANLDKVQRAVFTGLAAKGWIGTLVEPGHAHGVLTRDDWRCEIDVFYDTAKFSIRYAYSEHLDYDANKHVIHRNFNHWLVLLKEQINAAMSNPAL
jgi:hypothetical protein